MTLNDRPYEMMLSGAKTIEIRLFDDKRQKVAVGDSIVFVKTSKQDEAISAGVVELHNYSSFGDLLDAFPSADFGFGRFSKEQILEEINQIYDKEREQRLGVLGIRILVIPE